MQSDVCASEWMGEMMWQPSLRLRCAVVGVCLKNEQALMQVDYMVPMKRMGVTSDRGAVAYARCLLESWQAVA